MFENLCSKSYLSLFLSTSTEKVEWGEDFSECFTTNMNFVYFNEIPTAITVKWSDIETDEEDNQFITKFLVDSQNKKFVYETPVSDGEKLKLYLNPLVFTDEQGDEEDESFSISSKNIQEDTPIFTFTAKNNELTKSLQQILDLIESSSHLGITNMDDFVNKFADLLIENGLNYINSIHVELIASVLFRDEDGNRLDFTKENISPYTIYRISKVIMNGPLATSLSFERLNDQFSNVATYEKEDVSYTDYLFR